MADLVQCRSAFSVTVHGAPFVVSHGDILDRSDPVVRDHASNFMEVTVRSSLEVSAPRSYLNNNGPSAAVETATAAPGTRRRMSREPGERAAERATETSEV